MKMVLPDLTPLARAYTRRRLRALAGQHPAETQRRLLLGLVKHAAGTRFGRDHGFSRIASVNEFQARVPLRRYDALWREYWEGAYPILDGMTWPGAIPYIAFTSGTSSNSAKNIPISPALLAANRRAALEVMVHHLANRPESRAMGGQSFMLGGSSDLAEVAPGVRRGDLSGIAACEVPLWARPYSFPPIEEALETDWDAKIDRLAKLACGRDIRSISGTPSWVLLFFERMGKRAADLFPHLEAYIHGGVSIRPYTQAFARLLEGTHAEMREVYPASEGFIAVADRGFGEGLRLLVDNGLFFEFVPVAELDRSSPTRHWLGNAETGIDYALVLSTCAGLWAYVIGDVVRLVERAPPRLLVVGRTSYMLNVFGEHLSGEQIEDAVLAAAGGAAINDYAAGAQSQDGRGRHVFVMEFALPADVAAFATALDRHLCAGSLDFRERRAGNVSLDAPHVVAVPPGFFAGWMKHRGRLGGQNKVPRVINDERLLADLLKEAECAKGSRP
ncbi:MAG TPA: GH3 auxin-responsive promoter family protein [Magnetospirillum sp.]|jgi:hypothetical protein|nr:GH3 auxin-responsive promoter family protein [Magnetospirillum sp.]